MQKKIALLALFAFVATLASFAQKPSPPESATCDLGGGKSVKTNYSSPRMKGRKIYGELVPFGQVWRTGANEATTFVASSDVSVGGKAVPAGNYTIEFDPSRDGRGGPASAGVYFYRFRAGEFSATKKMLFMR